MYKVQQPLITNKHPCIKRENSQDREIEIRKGRRMAKEFYLLLSLRMTQCMIHNNACKTCSCAVVNCNMLRKNAHVNVGVISKYLGIEVVSYAQKTIIIYVLKYNIIQLSNFLVCLFHQSQCNIFVFIQKLAKLSQTVLNQHVNMA